MAYQLIPSDVNSLSEREYNYSPFSHLLFPSVTSCILIVGITSNQLLKGIHLSILSEDNTHIFAPNGLNELEVNIILENCSKFYISGAIDFWDTEQVITYLGLPIGNTRILQHQEGNLFVNFENGNLTAVPI